MKYIYIILTLNLLVVLATRQSVKTPTGNNVYSQNFTETYSAAQIAAADIIWQDSIINANWDATIQSSCSSIYNCHSYAWHMSDNGHITWIPYDTDVEKYYSGNSPSYEEVSSIGKYSKIYYNGAGHSARADETNQNYVWSKWGSGPLVRHAPGDCPYEGYTLKNYDVIIDNSPNSVNIGCSVNISALDISGATYFWSGDNTYLCAAGNTKTGSVTGLSLTPVYGKGEVNVEIISPYSNTTINGVKEFTVNDAPSNLPYISGSTLVCSSGESFTLRNLPVGNTITWSSSSNLSTANSTENPCTFTSIGNGSGWVKASLSTPCANNIFADVQYNVWSGKPVFTSFSGPSTTPNNQWATYYALPNNSLMAVTDYSWNLNPLNGNSLYDYGQSVDIAFYNSGSYQLIVQGKNTCSSPNFGPFYVGGIYVYDSYMMSIFPNPTSCVSTLTIESTSTEKTTDVNVEWELEIFSETQILKEKKTNLKGTEYEINSSGWKEGVYFVRVKYKNEVLQGKFIVKK